MEFPEDFSQEPREDRDCGSAAVWTMTGLALVLGYILALVILVPAR